MADEIPNQGQITFQNPLVITLFSLAALFGSKTLYRILSEEILLDKEPN